MTKRILAIGAHADDGVFWCGATLRKAAEQGHEVHYLSITKKEILAQYRALETNRGFKHSARYAEAFTPADPYVQDIV